MNRKDNHIARAEIFHYTNLLQGKIAHFEEIDFNTTPFQFEKNFQEQTKIEFVSSELATGRLADLTQQLIRIFNLNDDDPFLQFFLDEILLYTSRYGNSIGDFLVWWSGVKHKKSIIYPESMNAVRIMTIHKSKGLQFPVVILADAVEKKKLTKKFFWIPLEKKYLLQLNIGLLPCNKLMEETEFAHLYQREDEQSFLDLLNLLYVGTTRPEDALYILSEELEKEPEKNDSIIALLIAFLKKQQQWDGFQQYVFGKQDYAKKISKKGEQQKFELYKKQATQSANLLASSIKVKMKADLLWSNAATGKIDAGNLLHEALKQVKYEGDEETVLNKMKADGLLNEEEQIELQQKMKSVIYHADINSFFKRDYKVITERPLLKSNEKIRIPDRVVFKNGEAIVLDYKTGKQKPEHQKQLHDYANWLQEAGVKVNQKILFYTTEQKVEVV